MRLSALTLALLALPTLQAQAPKAAKAWPHPIPARVKDGANPDLFVMTLGDVTTPLAQGTFDPVKDQVTLKDGTVMDRYYKDTLKLPFYKPMDKSVFPTPPSGMCTWYYYYQDVNAKEVMLNTDWMAKHLKDYGATYVQVDDGWQKETEEGKHGSRDWTGFDKHFPDGMTGLAAYIKAKGLVPGIWIAPHGQSNEAVVKAHPGVFLLKPDGTSASVSWEGKWLVDPSNPASHTYLKDLFKTMVGWGYEYFKIDGQPTVVDEFRKSRQYMQKPGDAAQLYHQTVASIREAIGPNRYLLGCWGLPIEGMGIMDGSRTGGDIVRGWGGFQTALGPTMESYYQHNIVWYTDPDVMLLRSPLTLDQARAWAALQGLTGQALFASDRLMDLSEERVELLRRVYPAADIRPLDLFPSPRNKRIWDLKVNHLGRQYDVVGLFNFDEEKTVQLALSWKELGIPDQAPVHVYDFWNREYLGAWEAGTALEVPTTASRVVTLLPDNGQIQLVSTSRHMTQGWVDLTGLKTADKALSGTSKVAKQDPYTLTFAFPRGKNFEVSSAKATAAGKPLAVKVTDYQGWATVTFTSPKTQEVAWSVVFKPAYRYEYPTHTPEGLRVEPVGLDGAKVRWREQYYLNAGYQVLLDGQPVGATGSMASYPLDGLDPFRTYTVEVKSLWDDGSIGPNHKKAETKLTLARLLPESMPLSALEPVTSRDSGRFFGRAFTFEGNRREGIVNARPGDDTEYDVKGVFATFTATVAFDDGDGGSRALTFTVLGDGKELWTSGPLKKGDGTKAVSVPIAGVQRLALRAVGDDADNPGEDGRNGPWAAWLDGQISGRTPEPRIP